MNWHVDLNIGLNITYVVTEKVNFHHAKTDLFIQPLTHLWRNIIEWETWFLLPDNIFCSILFQMRLLFASWPLAPESLEVMCPCRELLVSWCTNTSRSADFYMTPQISKLILQITSYEWWRKHGILVISVSYTICVDIKTFITDKIETSHGKLCVVAFQQKTDGTIYRSLWYCRCCLGS